MVLTLRACYAFWSTWKGNFYCQNQASVTETLKLKRTRPWRCAMGRILLPWESRFGIAKAYLLWFDAKVLQTSFFFTPPY